MLEDAFLGLFVGGLLGLCIGGVVVLGFHHAESQQRVWPVALGGALLLGGLSIGGNYAMDEYGQSSTDEASTPASAILKVTRVVGCVFVAALIGADLKRKN